MGQNVNYLLGGQNQLLGADPEVYRQQLIQQEQAKYAAMPPQQALAAQLGGLLGRGLTNVAQDRNFFEVTNPVLQKLTKIQDIYDTSMKQADPNDPLSFYTTLQKNFAASGLGQQAMMAQVEAKKFEDLNLKGEKLKTEVYTANPQLLDAQIAKARDAGDDALANRLAEQRGQIQLKIDTDRAKEIADINYKNAATEAQRAQAGKLAQDIESGKFDWKVINDVTGTPTHMAKINKRTGETTYEPIALPGGAPIPGGKPTTPKPGERPPLSSFSATPTPATPSPVATTTAPVQTSTGPWNDTTKTYALTQDPQMQQIQYVAAQNADRLATDPTFREAITRAQNDRIAQIKQQYGSMINIQY